MWDMEVCVLLFTIIKATESDNYATMLTLFTLMIMSPKHLTTADIKYFFSTLTYILHTSHAVECHMGLAW